MSFYENARQETKEQIIRNFWTLYKEMPIEKITVQKLSDASEIHRSTFYFHFQDVYQVLEQIEERLLAKIQNVDVTNADTEEGMRQIGLFLFNEYRADREYLRILVGEHRDHKFSLRYREELERLMIRIAQDPEQKDSELNKRLLGITASVIIETFLKCADDETFSFEDTHKILRGFMADGYLKTLNECFSVEGLRNPTLDKR